MLVLPISSSCTSSYGTANFTAKHVSRSTTLIASAAVRFLCFVAASLVDIINMMSDRRIGKDGCRFRCVEEQRAASATRSAAAYISGVVRRRSRQR